MRQATFNITLTICIALAFTALSQPAPAQTLTTLHAFTTGADGWRPLAGLTRQGVETFYGTAALGGIYNDNNCPEGCGVVFQVKHARSGWLFTPIYSFFGQLDGTDPYGKVSIGPQGALYGTTSDLSNPNGTFFGTVFSLTTQPTAPRTALVQWNHTVIYGFAFYDAHNPQGDLAFDQSGNIYGSTMGGGNRGNCAVGGCGAVYELSPSGSGWTEQALYGFSGSSDGGYPYGGVIFDSSGNLYGVCSGGGLGYGVVYQLSPSDSGWLEHVLYTFTGGNTVATSTEA